MLMDLMLLGSSSFLFPLLDFICAFSLLKLISPIMFPLLGIMSSFVFSFNEFLLIYAPCLEAAFAKYPSIPPGDV